MADVTLEQYEALPENRRVEIFDGVIYDMASPSQIWRIGGYFSIHYLI